MVIRPAQIAALHDSLERAFVSRMLVHLSSGFGSHIETLGLDHLSLEEMIRRGIANAREYRVVEESDIELYLECMVLLGPDFDRRIPWCAAALQDVALSGAQKMDSINEYLLFGTEEPQ